MTNARGRDRSFKRPRPRASISGHIRAAQPAQANSQTAPQPRNQSLSINAVSAHRMETTSIASCRNAPTTTGIRLNAAHSIAMIDSDKPPITDCSMMRLVRREIAIARGTQAMSSFMMTTCADSDAAVDVPSVIAMPMSAEASTGASFTPSPTIMVMERVMDSPVSR